MERRRERQGEGLEKCEEQPQGMFDDHTGQHLHHGEVDHELPGGDKKIIQIWTCSA